VIKICLFVSLLLSCTSCSLNGRLYTNKVVPYSQNFDNTKLGNKVCYVTDFKVKEPFSGYNVSAEWMTSSIIQKAREAGISKIYYADMKMFSILSSLYTEKTLVIYGD